MPTEAQQELRPAAEPLTATPPTEEAAAWADVQESPPARLAAVLAPTWCAARLAQVALTLVALHVGLHLYHYLVDEVHWLVRGRFDLDEEQSFGTWFSAVALLASALAALACARRTGESTRDRLAWRSLAAGFLLLSLDEVAGIHETVNTATTFSWAIPGAILALIAGIAFLPFLAGLPLRTRTLLLLAGLVYVGGAVGIELTATAYGTREHLDTLGYSLTTALEEAMEMGGIILFLFATLEHLGQTAPDGVRLDSLSSPR